MKKYYTALSAFLLLSACSNKVDFETMSAEEIYNYAMNEMDKTRYAKAATAFETLETDHPYSQWAVRAKLMSAYAYYKEEKYDDAVMAVDRFIKYHPGNVNVPYALYLKGMCYYDQISSADKDQGNTQKAAETFNVLATMYPDSEYTKDANGKMNLTEDYKAGQEMIIGRYYLHEGNYLSALNRFNVVLENYQTTIQIEEALYRQVEIYAIFGMKNYANGYYEILQKNYPEGKWTAKAAKIMKKIGEETKPVKNKTVEDKTTESQAAVEEIVANAEESVAEAMDEAEEAKTESKSWFSRWFGSDDKATENTKQAEEVATAVEDEIADSKAEVENEAEEAKTESKSWFSGWFGSDDKATENTEQTEEVATAVEDEIADSKAEVENAAEEAKTEGKSWFSGWFGSDDDINDDMVESKKAANETINEVLNDANEEVEDAADTVQDAAEKAEQEHSSWYNKLFAGGTILNENDAE